MSSTSITSTSGVVLMLANQPSSGSLSGVNTEPCFYAAVTGVMALTSSTSGPSSTSGSA